MIQTITRPQGIMEKIQNLSPQQMDKVLEFIEFLEYQAVKEEAETIETENPQESISFAEAAKEFIGCVEGPENLSQMKKELKKGGLFKQGK